LCELVDLHALVVVQGLDKQIPGLSRHPTSLRLRHVDIENASGAGVYPWARLARPRLGNALRTPLLAGGSQGA
jgi:hypothetical protein